MTFDAGSGDGTPDTYVLSGYPAAPTSILVGIPGSTPFATSFDAIKGELSITPTESGVASVVEVVP